MQSNQPHETSDMNHALITDNALLMTLYLLFVKHVDRDTYQCVKNNTCKFQSIDKCYLWRSNKTKENLNLNFSVPRV